MDLDLVHLYTRVAVCCRIACKPVWRHSSE